MKTILLLSLLMGSFSTHAASVFTQDGMTTWTVGANTGTEDTDFFVTGGDPLTISTAEGVNNVRAYASTDAGIGQLDSYAQTVRWTFDLDGTHSGTKVSNSTYGVMLAGTIGELDEGSIASDGYIFGIKKDTDTWAFGHTTQGSKDGPVTTLYDTGIDGFTTGTGSVTVDYDPTAGTFAVSGTILGTNFASGAIADSTYTGVDTDFVGLGIRQLDGETSVSLSNFTVTAIPEPSTMVLVGISMLGLALLHRRRT